MKEFIINLFSQYASFVVLLHILSAVVWVGGMIALRFAVHFAVANIDDPHIKLGLILDYLKRFFSIVTIFIVILLFTAGFMAIGFGFKGTALYPVVHIKEGIWTIMTIVFIVININRNKAQKEYDNKNYKKAKQYLSKIANLFIPLNIILGIIAIYIGIILRGL